MNDVVIVARTPSVSRNSTSSGLGFELGFGWDLSLIMHPQHDQAGNSRKDRFGMSIGFFSFLQIKHFPSVPGLQPSQELPKSIGGYGRADSDKIETKPI